MKLIVENHYLRKIFGDREAIRIIAEAGFDGMDFSFFKLDENDDILKKPNIKEYALSLKEYAKSLGVKFAQAHAPLTHAYDDKSDFEEHFAEIVKSMEIASYLDVPVIIVHSIKCPKNIDFDDVNRKFYGRLAPYCEKFNIRIGVENLFMRDKVRECFVGQQGTPKEITAFVNTLDKKYFTVCLDTGHAALTGCEPQDFIRGMNSELLTALHIQDNDYKNDRHWLPYSGKLDWNEITSALAEIGYKGNLTLEIMHFIDRYPDDLQPMALTFACQVGRKLIKLIEEKQNGAIV